MKNTMKLVCAGLPFLLGSCYSFHAPADYDVASFREGGGVATEDPSRVSSSGRRRATVKFPTRVAVVRVEDNRYSQGVRLFDGRDLERPEHAASVQRLRGVTGMVSLNHISLQSGQVSYETLRKEALEIGAPMLAVYRFTTHEKSVEQAALLNTAALGILPTVKQQVVSNVSLIVQDARTGHTYGVMEKQAVEEFRSSMWGSNSSRENAKQRTRSQAFHELMSDLPQFWNEFAR